MEVIHNNPADYGLTHKDVVTIQMSNLRWELKHLRTKFLNIKSKLLSNHFFYTPGDLNTVENEIRKTEDQLRFKRNSLDKDYVPRSYDIARIKTIPLDTITQILSTGFFVNNPFRREKSPSNSLHWEKKSNRWYDFATSESGDVIDLYCKINGCDTKTAMRELSTR
jgi:hypothetical protein